MAGATNPGNVGHAWVKALWVDHKAPPGFQRGDLYDASDYDFIRARIEDNPIYANDIEYRRTLEALPEHLRGNILMASTSAATPRGRKTSVSSSGGRGGSRLTGDFSIPAPCIGIVQFRVAQVFMRRGP
jgi:hypothetical protein